VCFCLRNAEPFFILLEKMKKEKNKQEDKKEKKTRCGIEDRKRKIYIFENT
jgi:hypothetical protein